MANQEDFKIGVGWVGVGLLGLLAARGRCYTSLLMYREFYCHICDIFHSYIYTNQFDLRGPYVLHVHEKLIHEYLNYITNLKAQQLSGLTSIYERYIYTVLLDFKKNC